jgi:hypothetical protein
MSGNHLRRNDAQFCVYPEYLSDILYESSHNPELFVLMEATKPDAGRKSVGSGEQRKARCGVFPRLCSRCQGEGTRRSKLFGQLPLAAIGVMVTI